MRTRREQLMFVVRAEARRFWSDGERWDLVGGADIDVVGGAVSNPAHQ